MSLSPDVYLSIQQFYYREARLLDDRQFQQWLGLLTEDVQYCVPARHVPLPDIAARDTEAFHEVTPEFGEAGEPPFRDDNFLTLGLRASRALKAKAWAENPPARTRRFVSNIEPVAIGEGQWQVFSHFMLSYSRHGRDNCMYTGQRIDRLREIDGQWKLAHREVRLDWNVITAPSLGLFF